MRCSVLSLNLSGLSKNTHYDNGENNNPENLSKRRVHNH